MAECNGGGPTAGVTRNPYSSHLLEPARGGYIFSNPGEFELIIDTFERYGWRGELTGPHGAGKSTLLADLNTRLQNDGRRVVLWRCSGEQRRLPRHWLSDLHSNDIVALDGGERLLPGLLLFLRIITRIMRRGLIITTHRRTGFGAVVPVTASTKTLTRKIMMVTGSDTSPDLILLNRIDERLKYHHGNAREVLFDLYIGYEQQKGNTGGSRILSPDAP